MCICMCICYIYTKNSFPKSIKRQSKNRRWNANSKFSRELCITMCIYTYMYIYMTYMMSIYIYMHHLCMCEKLLTKAKSFNLHHQHCKLIFLEWRLMRSGKELFLYLSRALFRKRKLRTWHSHFKLDLWIGAFRILGKELLRYAFGLKQMFLSLLFLKLHSPMSSDFPYR